MELLEEKYLRLFKDQINVDFEEKDEELSHLLQSAFEYSVDVTNRTAEDLKESGGGDYPLPFIQAVIILAKHWWETGGTMVNASMRENPMGYWTLVNRYVDTID